MAIEHNEVPRARGWRGWVGMAVVLAIGWFAVECFIGTSHKVNHNTYVPPLDDTYIYYQYAKQIARGQLYRYQDGEQVSTGSTSTLYPLLMAPAWGLGLRGPSIFWAGFYVNVLGLLLSIGLLYASLRKLLPDDPWMPLLGALLGIGNGWFLWGIASGMDTGVLAASLALTIHGVVLYSLGGRERLLAVALALLGVSRPEGLVLAWVTVLALTLQRCAGRAAPAPVPGLAPLAAAWRWLRGLMRREHLPSWRIILGLLVGTTPTILLAIASGHLSTNGMMLKSQFAHQLGWLRYIDVVSRTLMAIPERLLFVVSPWLRGPIIIALLVGVGALCGGLTLGRRANPSAGGTTRTPGWVAGSWCLTIFLFYGFLMTATEQHNRYFMAYWPLVALLVTTGVHAGSLVFPSAAQASIRRTGALALALLGLGSIPHWAREYAYTCKDINEQHVAMSNWVNQVLPPSAVLAINDAGALAYLTRRRVIDVFGLVSNDFRAPGHWRAEGYIWEGLERRRPTHLIIYPSWFDDLHRLPCLRRVHSVDLKRDTLLGDREKVAFEIDWSQVLSADVPRALPAAQADWKLMDMVDVADIVSEGKHDYRVRQGEVLGGAMFKLMTFFVTNQRLIDGGRSYSDSESFRAHGLRPGAPLLLGVRSNFENGETRLEVEVGSWRQRWTPGTREQKVATEAYLLVPAEAITESSPKIRIRCLDRREGLASFHWFMLQPR